MLFVAAIFLLFVFLLWKRPEKSIPLSAPSEAYWNNLARSMCNYDKTRYFPEGIPTNTLFGEWMLSETNRFVRRFAVNSVLSVDRTNAIRFLEWMERNGPRFENDRVEAFFFISVTTPYWDKNRPAKWTQEEIAGFSPFFRRRFESETNLQCRVKMDEFFLLTDPTWKPSEERLAFLERSLSLCRNEGASNTILRIMSERLKPVDVEQYERVQRMLRH